MPSLPEEPQSRISEDDRNTAVQRLQEAYAEGHISYEEMDESLHLDLSRAVIEHRIVDIELQLGTGRARITVPRDAIVDVENLHTGWKDTRYKTPRNTSPGGPTIRISGTMGFGRLRIRHARR